MTIIRDTILSMQADEVFVNKGGDVGQFLEKADAIRFLGRWALIPCQAGTARTKRDAGGTFEINTFQSGEMRITVTGVTRPV